jgi:ABC-2 type transport system permease protein
VYNGFEAVSRIPALQGGADYWIESLGVDAHYRSMSRGLLELKDVLYFGIICALFLLLTQKMVLKK